MNGMDKAKNQGQKLAGMAKEAIGKATGDKATEHEGKRDQAMANLKDAGEKLKDAGEKLKEEAGERLKDAGEKLKDEAGEKVKEAGEKVANMFKK